MAGKIDTSMLPLIPAPAKEEAKAMVKAKAMPSSLSRAATHLKTGKYSPVAGGPVGLQADTDMDGD